MTADTRSGPFVGADACPSCGSGRVIRLDLHLTDGTPVVFTSCRGCESRWYVGPDGDLAVGDVLARSVKPGKGSVPARSKG
jgi:hypothetical protein